MKQITDGHRVLVGEVIGPEKPEPGTYGAITRTKEDVARISAAHAEALHVAFPVEGEVLPPAGEIPRESIPQEYLWTLVNKSYEDHMRKLIEGDWVRRERNVTDDVSPDPDQAELPALESLPPERTEHGKY
jgi:hypothetical protein